MTHQPSALGGAKAGNLFSLFTIQSNIAAAALLALRLGNRRAAPAADALRPPHGLSDDRRLAPVARRRDVLRYIAIPRKEPP